MQLNSHTYLIVEEGKYDFLFILSLGNVSATSTKSHCVVSESSASFQSQCLVYFLHNVFQHFSKGLWWVFGYYSIELGRKQCLWLLGNGFVVKAPKRRWYRPRCPTHGESNSSPPMSILSSLYWIQISSACCSLELSSKLRIVGWRNRHSYICVYLFSWYRE